MLDDRNVLMRKDSKGILGAVASQYEQATLAVEVAAASHDARQLKHVVVIGLEASLFAKVWLDDRLAIPFEVVKNHRLPRYIGESSLVIVGSLSEGDKEALAILDEVRVCGAQVAVVAGNGALVDRAREFHVAHVVLPDDVQTQSSISTIAQLRALVALLNNFDIVGVDALDEIAAAALWLRDESMVWAADVPTDKNYAKQLALHAVGKVAVFYGGELTGPVAYQWKTSWNEIAKNIAFWNEYPACGYDEFVGWTGHPVEKPFAVFDFVSHFENEQVLKMFAVSDRLLSGRRPKAVRIDLRGDTLLRQLLWATILANFVSFYVAMMNNADPGPSSLAVRLKQELA